MSISLKEKTEILENEFQMKEMNEPLPPYEILDYVKQHKKVVSKHSLNLHELVSNLEHEYN